MTIHAHDLLARSWATGWACKIIDCDTAGPPKACVLLLVSVLMMLVTIVAYVVAGL